MALPGDEIFLFTWRIENFSMSPQQCGEGIEGPPFVVEFLKNTEWQLVVYPRGYLDRNYAICNLHRTACGDYAEDITVLYKLEVLSTLNGVIVETEMTRETFHKYATWGRLIHIAREEFFKYENGFLLNDTFTVRCQLRKYVEDPVKKESVALETVDTGYWNSRGTSNGYQCSARTQIRVSSKSCLWPIMRIGELQRNMKLTRTLPSVMEDEPSFDLAFYWSGDSEESKCAQIEICRKSATKDEKSTGLFVRCNITTVKVPKNVQRQERGEHYFNGERPDDVWKFPKFLEMTELTDNYFVHTRGTLYLQCDFSYCAGGDVLDVANTSEMFPRGCAGRVKSYTSTSAWEKLFKDEKFSDITLRVEDREFKVHKNILRIGSDVFSAMFESDMREQDEGIVDITDLDPDTVERLLRYMYTDVLDELDPQSAVKLYSAANKYNVSSLQHWLHSTLITSLSVCTVCEVLALADAYQDEDLLECVRNYIYRNAHQIFRSGYWKNFTESNVQLSASTMLYILTKK